ncbi:MAG: hypothetical protein R2867_23500 [Caldilineaceae bacterium]
MSWSCALWLAAELYRALGTFHAAAHVIARQVTLAGWLLALFSATGTVTSASR